jgi:hypothetical protein
LVEELRDNLLSSQKEKEHLMLDIAQKNYIINRMEKQIQDLSNRVFKPYQEPVAQAQAPTQQQATPKAQDSGKKTPNLPDANKPANNFRRSTPKERLMTTSTITRADDLSVNISRPDSPGLSNYKDDLELKRGKPGEFVDFKKPDAKDDGSASDRPVDQIPDQLKAEPSDSIELPPLDISEPISFDEFRKRWKQSLFNNPAKVQLMLMVTDSLWPYD